MIFLYLLKADYFEIGLGSILLVSRAEVMFDRDGWGHSYLTVRGVISGFVRNGLLPNICQDVFINQERS